MRGLERRTWDTASCVSILLDDNVPTCLLDLLAFNEVGAASQKGWHELAIGVSGLGDRFQELRATHGSALQARHIPHALREIHI